MTLSENIKVIVFDTFGTVVDWRGSIIRDLSTWGQAKGVAVDWEAFVDAWRDEYEPEKNRVRTGEIPWTNLDDLHRHALLTLLAQRKLSDLAAADVEHINTVWHRLHGWPDAVPGLTRLKARFVIGPLSNGNVSLLVNMAKFANLPWDNVFSCQLFRHYKPHPETYLGVATLMNVPPSAVMMCAAHNYDLAAARKQGLKTAFIPRPTEYGPKQTTDLAPSEGWDLVVKDLEELAEKLDA